MHSSQQLVCMLLSCHAVSFRQSLLSLSPVRFRPADSVDAGSAQGSKGAATRDLLGSKALLEKQTRCGASDNNEGTGTIATDPD